MKREENELKEKHNPDAHITSISDTYCHERFDWKYSDCSENV